MQWSLERWLRNWTLILLHFHWFKFKYAHVASGHRAGQCSFRALGHCSNFSIIVTTWRVFLPKWYVSFSPWGQPFCIVTLFSLCHPFVAVLVVDWLDTGHKDGRVWVVCPRLTLPSASPSLMFYISTTCLEFHHFFPWTGPWPVSLLPFLLPYSPFFTQQIERMH